VKSGSTADTAAGGPLDGVTVTILNADKRIGTHVFATVARNDCGHSGHRRSVVMEGFGQRPTHPWQSRCWAAIADITKPDRHVRFVPNAAIASLFGGTEFR
jgi:hypothetical protein